MAQTTFYLDNVSVQSDSGDWVAINTNYSGAPDDTGSTNYDTAGSWLIAHLENKSLGTVDCTAVTLGIRGYYTGTTSRDQYFIVELLDETNTLVTNATYTTTALPAGSWGTFESTSITISLSGVDLDGYRLRITSSEGGGMSGTMNGFIDAAWATITYTTASNNFTENPSNTTNVSQSFSPVTSYQRSVDNTANVSEDIAKNIGKAPSDDTANVSESFNYQLSASQVESDTVNISDNPPTFDINKSEDNNVNVSEDFSPVTNWQRSIDNTANVSESFSAELTLTLDLSNSVSITEDFSRAITYNRSFGSNINLVSYFSTNQPVLTLRNTKGSQLTWTEFDENFNYINVKKLQWTINSIVSSASITPDSNHYYVTALAEAATINAPSGTPENGQRILIRIEDNGTSQTLSWNAIYRGFNDLLPTSTSPGVPKYICAVYNSEDTKWDVLTII